MTIKRVHVDILLQNYFTHIQEAYLLTLASDGTYIYILEIYIIIIYKLSTIVN